jgi:two-component system chemotaxis sensor kinase CheA
VIALPMTHVERALHVPSRALQRTDGGTVWPRPDAPPLHLLWLSALIGETREKDGDVLTVVVVRDRDRALGFVVPEILGESDFVLRPLPWNLVRVPGIAGAAVLGDGRIALLLHLESFLAHGKDGARAYEPNAEVGARRMGRTVLVVDDSVTSRILLRNILSTAGYEVVVADDGEEAWDILQRQPVDLVVTDVQMPRLDGHGLCRRIRKDPQTADLPVIMVTSLARPEDVTLGRQAGADEYVVKGRFDAKSLLEAVARLSA